MIGAEHRPRHDALTMRGVTPAWSTAPVLITGCAPADAHLAFSACVRDRLYRSVSLL
jgi:hypothetical protein